MKQDHNGFVNIQSAIFAVAFTLSFSLLVIITLTNMISPSYTGFPSFVFAQGQQNFTANLVGQDVVPPTNSKATGTSEFTLNSDGTSMNYEVYVTNIGDITLAQIYKGEADENGPALSTLIRFKDITPSGQVNGLLTQGVITADSLQGPLSGKQVSDLTELMQNNNTYVEIQTTENPNGEIRGQIIK
jgi:CHRD domain-containing protein